jgi:diaminopimelate decarboxylase
LEHFGESLESPAGVCCSNSAELPARNLRLNDESPITVEPALHEEAQHFLSCPQTIHDLVAAFGSPLNLIFPEIFRENLMGFLETFTHHTLEGTVYFTGKPNKSCAIQREASVSSAGMDVSSVTSLRSALSHGFHPQRIEATGPKNKEYLALAIQHGVVVNIDSLEELALALEIKQALQLSERLSVFIRLNGFSSSHTHFSSSDSTFGTNVKQAAAIFDLLEQNRRSIHFKGFSFHLNTPALTEKLIAIENTLELTFEAITRGFQPDGVNIGGGFRINYAKHAHQWLHFVETLKASLLSKNEAITWNRSGLGFYRDGSRVRGAANFMDHVVNQEPADQLCALLSQPMKSFGGIKAGQLLSESMLKLYIEPGRAMLNQMGITVARVAQTKLSEQDEHLVVLEMNRSNLNATELKLLTDPILIPTPDRATTPYPKGVFYTGSLCVHNELIMYRKHYPQFLPARGDLVVFANTAPYMMDFVESNTLQQPIARKLAVFSQNNRYTHALDELYQPKALRNI